MKFLRYIFFAAAVASAAAVSAKEENACVNKVADCDRLAEAAAVAGCKIFPGGTLDFLGPVHCREPTVRTVVMRRMIPTYPEVSLFRRGVEGRFPTVAKEGKTFLFCLCDLSG